MRLASLAVGSLLVLSGCQTNTGTILDSKAAQGALLGTLAGAAAGAAIGGHDHRGGGALIGAATGAIAGGLIGSYLDKQAQELDAIPGAEVQRRGDSLLVNFQSTLLFDTGSSDLKPGAYDRLRSLCRTAMSRCSSPPTRNTNSPGAWYSMVPLVTSGTRSPLGSG